MGKVQDTFGIDEYFGLGEGRVEGEGEGESWHDQEDI